MTTTCPTCGAHMVCDVFGWRTKTPADDALYAAAKPRPNDDGCPNRIHYGD